MFSFTKGLEMGTWLAVDNVHGYVAALRPGGVAVIQTLEACEAAMLSHQREERYEDQYGQFVVPVADPPVLAHVGFSSDGAFLAVAGASSVMLFEVAQVATRREAATPFGRIDCAGPVEDMRWNVGHNGTQHKGVTTTWGHYLAVVAGGQLAVHDVTALGAQLVRELAPTATMGRITSVSWSPPGTRGTKLVAGTSTGETVVAAMDLSEAAEYPKCARHNFDLYPPETRQALQDEGLNDLDASGMHICLFIWEKKKR